MRRLPGSRRDSGWGSLPLPGTIGALPGILLAWLTLRWPRRIQLFVAVSLVVLAVPLCDIASRTWEGSDDKRIVADEFLGFPTAVAGQTIARQPLVLAGAFLTSRVLDGLKLPPANQAENILGGLGMVLDDVVTNLYTWLLLAGGNWIYRHWRRANRPRRN